MYNEDPIYNNKLKEIKSRDNYKIILNIDTLIECYL